jgi:hypothetical protein
MKQRCFNPRHPKYPDYGGRGITVWDDWCSFVNYYAVTGHPPPGMSLDRIDNDGNYEPGNVRWTTRCEQQRNRRPPKLRIKRGDHNILAGIKRLTESLARAVRATP